MKSKINYLVITTLLIANFIQNNFANSTIKCVGCSFENIKCVQNPEQIKPTECLKGFNQCFTAVDKDGSTVRGCYYEKLHYCQGNYNCTVCSEDNCNNKILPSDRIRCYQCSGDNCLNINETNLLPCYNYKNDDECYTHKSVNETIYGCKSDLLYKDNCKNDNSCSICKGTGCNMKKECYNCQGNDQKCKKPENIDNIEKIECEPDLNGNLCYTYLDENNLITRGCASQRNFTNNKGYYVELCKENKCNTKLVEKINCLQCNSKSDKDCGNKDFKNDWIKENGCIDFNNVCHLNCRDKNDNIFSGCGKPPHNSFNCTYCYSDCDKKHNETNPEISSCYKCRSDLNENCKNQIEKLSPSICKNQNENDKIGCYVQNLYGLIRRGCQSDLNGHEYERCLKSKKCKLCNTNNCNNEKSSATKYVAVNGLTLIILLLPIYTRLLQ